MKGIPSEMCSHSLKFAIWLMNLGCNPKGQQPSGVFLLWYKLPSINHYKTFQALEAGGDLWPLDIPAIISAHGLRWNPPPDLDQFSSLCWPRSMYAKTGKDKPEIQLYSARSPAILSLFSCPQPTCPWDPACSSACAHEPYHLPPLWTSVPSCAPSDTWSSTYIWMIYVCLNLVQWRHFAQGLVSKVSICV